jgi:hypothetical protein
MMRKIPGTRPETERVVRVLGLGEERPSPALTALAAADAAVGTVIAKRQAFAEQKVRIQGERERLHGHAVEVFGQLATRLMEHIQEGAMNVHVSRERAQGLSGWKARCGQAQLEMRVFDGVVPGADIFPRSHWDVVAAGSIGVIQYSGVQIGGGQLPHQARSASLWFTNQGQGDAHRWTEVGYFRIGAGPGTHEPFAVGLGDVMLADEAASPALGMCRFGSGPHLIDDEDFGGFANRWIAVFASAIAGTLRPPNQLPVHD